MHSFLKSTLAVFDHESFPASDHIRGVYMQAEKPGYPSPSVYDHYYSPVSDYCISLSCLFF